jgi:Ca2+-binding RTX toxin-like protein
VTDTFVINVLQGNRAPVTGAAQVFLGSEDLQLVGQLAAGSDPDGDAIAYRLVTNSAQHGAITFFDPASGVFAFLGSEDYAGPASFQYYVTDGVLNSAPTTVTIDLAPVNDGAAPLALTGSGVVGQVMTGLIGVDPDGPWDPALATYRWFSDGVLITGATTADYVIQAADLGHRLSAEATYVDGQGFTATVFSPSSGPLGRFFISALAGVSTATLTTFSTINDPDGNPLPESVYIDWEVSADGTTWDFAPIGRLNFDFTTLTQPNSSSQFVRATMTYIDGLGNLEVVTSDPMRVIVGTGGGTAIAGTAGADIIFGLGGVDTINGGAIDDIIIGGAGSDNMNGGDGNDLFIYNFGDGTDAFNGGVGIDTLRVYGTTAGETLNAIMFGGALSRVQNSTVGVELVYADLGDGIDTISYSSTTAANDVVVSLTLGIASGFASVSGIENITGGAGNDTLAGDDNANTIRGGAGGDVLLGGAGADTLLGEAGDDRFVATIDDGSDAYTGGAGIDTLDLSGTNAGATVNLLTGVATGAEIGSDTLVTIEKVIGGSGADTIVASTVRNTFTGGLGSDVFRFETRQAAGNGAANRDIITDFAHLTDRIDISLIDADTRGVVAASGLQHFIFDGQVVAGSEAAGHVGYHYETLNGVEYTVLEGNVRTTNGADTTIDFQVALEGHLTLTSADFIFGTG